MPKGQSEPPSPEAIRRALAEFGVNASDEQIPQIQKYMAMLLIWNDKISLTAIRDPLEILYRHFCESMYAAGAVPLESGRLADVGSGGGFPGLPLKILRPALHVSLIESNVKKATFLAEVARHLKLTETRVLVSRYEELSEELTPIDTVCTRAVGEFAPFLKWAGSERIAARQIVLWIGGRDVGVVREIKGWKWRDPLLMPHSLQRYLLVGEREPPQVDVQGKARDGPIEK